MRRIEVARLPEMLHHPRAQRGLLRGAPFAEPFARFEAEFTGRHKPFQIRRGPRRRLDIRQHGPVDSEREIGADEIGVFERTEDCEPAPEGGFDDGIDRLGVADAALDQRDRFACSSW